MDDEKLKLQIGSAISAYRKQSGLTQAELAEKLNYSDKAVSKWERGESMPDVLTLISLAEQFGVTVNDLLRMPSPAPEAPRKTEAVHRPRADRRVIRQLSAILVWFIALLTFVVLSSVSIPYSWLAFFYAVPVSAIVGLTLRSAWGDFRRNRLLISVIMWGSLLSVYASLLAFVSVNVWKIFLLGIPGQLAIFLWFRMFPAPKEETNG